MWSSGHEISGCVLEMRIHKSQAWSRRDQWASSRDVQQESLGVVWSESEGAVQWVCSGGNELVWSGDDHWVQSSGKSHRCGLEISGCGQEEIYRCGGRDQR